MGNTQRGTGLLRDPRASRPTPGPTRSSGPTASWPASCTRTSTPTRRRRSGSREVSAAYEVLSDPEKRRIVDLGGDPLGNGRAGAGGAGDPFSGVRLRRHHGRLLRRPGHRRPRAGSAQPGAARRRRADPDAAHAGGVRHRRQPRPDRGHRGALLGVQRLGLRPRHRPHDVRHLQRPRRGAERAAVVPRPGRHVPAVPDLPRFRRGHPGPVPAVRRRRPGARPPQRRRARSRPGWPTGCGCGWPARARSAPAVARPATCTSRSRRSRTSCSPATAPTCTARCSCR